MRHYCEKCGATPNFEITGASAPELPCEHDYLDDCVTERLCPECNEHGLPMEHEKQNHWQCPNCNELVEFM